MYQLENGTRINILLKKYRQQFPGNMLPVFLRIGKNHMLELLIRNLFSAIIKLE